MKKIFLIFLFLISQNVFGEWIEVIRTDRDDIFFIDPDTIKKYEGNKVRFWYKLEAGATEFDVDFKSSSSYEEVDCFEKSSRTLSSVFYSENYLKGKLIARRDEPRKPFYYHPSSSFYQLIELVCK